MLASLFILSCEQEAEVVLNFQEWTREQNPILRDTIVGIDYQVASDAHVFMDGNTLRVIYTGDDNDKPAIKLATYNSPNSWDPSTVLLGNDGLPGPDANKETAFYRKSVNGKHQIYYIGYEDEITYESQIFLAEADSLKGPYIRRPDPIVAKGLIAGKDVYLITSPSVVEHQNTLYMTFIGWNDSPLNVTEVWVIGATSSDDGHTWSDFQLVDAKIAMEGQITQVNDNRYISVRTGDFENGEAIFYATAPHPFGPWTEKESPILVQAGPPFEKDEIIAPQIFVEPISGEEVLYYTGADHAIGWWIMKAKE